MRKAFQIFTGLLILGTPIAVYFYTVWLGIKLFLVPAFKLYFDMYGVWGTFGIWAGLFLMSFVSSYAFFRLVLTPYKLPQATFKRSQS